MSDNYLADLVKWPWQLSLDDVADVIESCLDLVGSESDAVWYGYADSPARLFRIDYEDSQPVAIQIVGEDRVYRHDHFSAA